jgi:D-glycero-alpha-D-manno-heptose 1-phosphate guanylyltransferase
MADYPAIVLAGGLGTRLRGVINDLPKPMAMINGKPFLHYVLLYLTQQKVKKAILSVGYKANIIETYFGDKYLDVELVYSKELEPLGTGGGIKKAFEYVKDFAWVLNGDTFFDINLSALSDFHFKTKADVSLALKQMENFDRYGTVEMMADRIVKFEEKKPLAEGLINGGVYFFNKAMLDRVEEQKFSFEKEVLEKYVSVAQINGKAFRNYFIDIGIPEDYTKAQLDFIKLFE